MDPKVYKIPEPVSPLKPCMEPRLLSKPCRVQKLSGESSVRMGENSVKDLHFYAPLYKAAAVGDWQTAEKIFESDPAAMYAQISGMSETALHVAAESGQTKFVKKLVEKMSSEKLEVLKDYYGRTALHAAVRAGDLEAAKAMVMKNPNLPKIRSIERQTLLCRAAIRGFKDLLWFLCEVTKDEDPSPFRGIDGIKLINAAILTGCYDIALHLIQRFPELALERAADNFSALDALARNSSAFKSGCRLGFWQRCIYSLVPVNVKQASSTHHRMIDPSQSSSDPLVHVEQSSIAHHCMIGDMEDPTRSSSDHSHQSIMHQLLQRTQIIQVQESWNGFFWNAIKYLVPSVQHIHDTKLMHHLSNELVKRICEELILVGQHDLIISSLKKAVLLAAEFGTVEVIDLCLQSYPEVFRCHYPTTYYTMLHVAVIHRQVEVFRLLQKYKAPRNNLARWKDHSTENNILHLAAKLAPSTVLKSVSGTALQMQRELQWYKEVEKIVRPSYKELKNLDGKTPPVLFTEEHSDLLDKGEKWMKDTAQSCMVVSALIATVVFTAAITVPGGNRNDGIPILLKDKSFMVFVIADGLALFSSATSVLIFLSILTSRYAEEDFLESLPKKLIIGLFTLFFSIATMMIAFSATFFIMLSNQLSWLSILIALVASLPVSFFALSHFHLLVEIFLSTYKSNFFQ